MIGSTDRQAGNIIIIIIIIIIAANVAGKDLDTFSVGAVSLYHIVTR
jgi:hypothetical protein